MPDSPETTHLLESFWTDATAIWADGGWAMGAIAVIAMMIFGFGMRVLIALRGKGFDSVPEDTWRRWIEQPWQREGPIGRLLDFATGGESTADTAFFFEQLNTTEAAPIDRDLRIMKICVGAAPLVGLLGTVTGMLATFGALAAGSGGAETMASVANGISEALITTETGLVIALPGVFFHYQLLRRFERYRAFLAHLETVCNQTLHRELRRREHAAARDLARARIASSLQQGVS